MNREKTKIEKAGIHCPQGMYPVHCYEIDSNTRYTFFWTPKQFEMAEALTRMGAITIIPNLGYFYNLEKLKKGMEMLGRNPYWND